MKMKRKIIIRFFKTFVSRNDLGEEHKKRQATYITPLN